MEVFVYGTLRENEVNHNVMKNLSGEFICRFKLNGFKVYQGFYPYMTYSKPTDFVYGEIYNVPDNMIDILDSFEGTPDLYERVEIESTEHTFSAYLVSDKEILNDIRLGKLS